VREVGEERRERREEHRVHCDERADQEEQAAHLAASVFGPYGSGVTIRGVGAV
jgi:hypothetical protein